MKGNTVQKTRPLGFTINLLARQLERQMADVLRPLGLTPAFLPVMLSLAESEPKTQKELAALLDIRQPTMAATLNRMERDGLIIRSPGTEDRRSMTIILTDKAKDLMPQVQEYGQQIGEVALEILPADRRVQLLSDLEAVSTKLAAAD